MTGTARRLAVGCTDKGQHGWTDLGDLHLDGLLSVNVGFVYGEVAEHRKAECVWLDQLDPMDPASRRVHLQCPRCRRHVQWKWGRAVDVVTGMVDAGLISLDISSVP